MDELLKGVKENFTDDNKRGDCLLTALPFDARQSLFVFFVSDMCHTWTLQQQQQQHRLTVVPQRAALLAGPSSRYQGRGTERAEWETHRCASPLPY